MKPWVVVLLLVSYALLTRERVAVWESDNRLFLDAAWKAPCLNRPMARLAWQAKERGDILRYGFWMPMVVELETEGRCLDGSSR